MKRYLFFALGVIAASCIGCGEEAEGQQVMDWQEIEIPYQVHNIEWKPQVSIEEKVRKIKLPIYRQRIEYSPIIQQCVPVQVRSCVKVRQAPVMLQSVPVIDCPTGVCPQPAGSRVLPRMQRVGPFGGTKTRYGITGQALQFAQGSGGSIDGDLGLDVKVPVQVGLVNRYAGVHGSGSSVIDVGDFNGGGERGGPGAGGGGPIRNLIQRIRERRNGGGTGPGLPVEPSLPIGPDINVGAGGFYQGSP